MQFSNKSPKYQAQISACINAFYFFLRWNNIDAVYAMLSPNLRRFLSVKQYEDKFKKVFIVGANVTGYDIPEQKETVPGIVNAVVIIGVKPNEKGDTEGKPGSSSDSDETKYCAYRFTFIDIDDCLYIDDAYLDNNFQATTLN